MRLHLTARHCELDPEDRLLVEQRLEKLSRFARDILEAHVTVSAEKYRHTAEITLKLAGHEIASREEAHGARVALERAADRLEHQIRRLKERRLDWRRGDRTRAADLDAASESAAAGPEEHGTAAEE
jgi:putative sigma-54 modulation protein